MKTKLIGFICIFLIYAFPFKYAVLAPTSSQAVNLLCMVATVVGTLIFMFVTMTDGKPASKAEVKESKEEAFISKKAA